MTPLLKPFATSGWAVLLTAILLVAAALPAIAWFSASTSLHYAITTGTWEDDDPDDEDADDPDASGKVWICKLVGPPGSPRLSSGENPIQVDASATSDGRFNDQHGSPVVEEGDDCDELDLDQWPAPEELPEQEPDTPSPPTAEAPQGPEPDTNADESTGSGDTAEPTTGSEGNASDQGTPEQIGDTPTDDEAAGPDEIVEGGGDSLPGTETSEPDAPSAAEDEAGG